MKPAFLFSALIGLALLPGLAFAQGKLKKEEDFLKARPRVGDRVPDVVVYDSRGNEINTASLRGHYTVLTFGCLT